MLFFVQRYFTMREFLETVLKTMSRNRSFRSGLSAITGLERMDMKWKCARHNLVQYEQILKPSIHLVSVAMLNVLAIIFCQCVRVAARFLERKHLKKILRQYSI